MAEMSITSPGEVYGSMLDECRRLRQNLSRNARYYAISRFLSFLSFAASVYAAFAYGAHWWIPAALMLVFFLALVMLNEKTINRTKFNDACIRALSDETAAIDGLFGSFDGGNEFNDPTHMNTTDLDVFGEGSLFQSVNRTASSLGKRTLASWLRNPLLHTEDIKARQLAVRELASRPEWRTHFRAHGMVAGEEKSDLELLFEWLKSDPLFGHIVFRIALYLIPVASFTATALLISGHISVQFFLLYLIIPLSVTGFYTKTINARHAMLSKKVHLLKKYSIRFRMIEDEGFVSPFMSGLAGRLKSGSRPASEGIHRLGRITASLDTRLNILAGFILNLYLLWDIRQMSRLEQWQSGHREILPLWFDALAETEAIASFGAFSYINPGFVYPEMVTDRFIIQAVEAGHPLIRAAKRVNNPVQINHRGHFNIVTGANMAGKSTYLRTIGVNMVLALAGAPVCASSFRCYPAAVYTSLRTTDSLNSNQSYFYAELLRLKVLIDRLNRGEELFVLLDEILKGTNSADKQAGSRALLAQLIGLGAAGCIATHDLELGKLQPSYPDDIRNYCFEAEISGDELHFSYQLKDGIAQNMNATFLMKKMGITV